MALIDRLRPYYEIGVACENCGKKCNVRIKKGVSIKEAIKDKQLNCQNCKCVITPREYTTQWLK